MFKIYATLSLIACYCMHEVHGALPNRRFLASQVAATPVAPPSAAPYPAAGVTPEVPFDLPTETTVSPQPDLTYGPPVPTYGPPDQTYGPPDQTYGPPADTPAIVDPAAAGDDGTEGSGDVVSQNIIQPRFRQARPLKLRALPPRSRPQANLVEIIRSEPLFVYTLE